jgi:uncharacterized protein (DUF1800 family)
MPKTLFTIVVVSSLSVRTFGQDTAASAPNGAAARFLEQATWGPTPASIQEARRGGIQGYLQNQFQQPPSYYDTSTGITVQAQQKDFFVKAMYGPDQLRQRVAFALSEIWVIAAPKINDGGGWGTYMNLLLRDAFTNYSTIMYDVTLNPGMGHYLDMVNNDKPSPARSANENYAREFMQLFTIGEVLLNPDGTVQLENGKPTPSYSETDVQNLGRAFTGWTYPVTPGMPAASHNPAYWLDPMVATESNHDTTSKTLVGGVVLPAGQTAEQDLQAVIQVFANHQNLAPFICRQLIEHLVSSNPSVDYISRVVTAFLLSHGDMQSVIRAILLDPEARQGDFGGPIATGGHLREPLLYVLSLLRSLNATVTESNNLTSNASQMGQNLFNAPSVFSYFSPNYRIGSLAGPEFQLQSPSTSLIRANLVNTMVYSSLGGGTVIDISPYVTLATNPNSMLSALNGALMHGQMSDAMKSEILAAVSVPGMTATQIAQAAIYLIASSTQYQVEH